MADLEEINNNLIRVITHVEHIKEDITDMKAEREKHQNVFWNRINSMDNEIKSVKMKVGVMTVGIATIVTIAIAWLRKQF